MCADVLWEQAEESWSDSDEPCPLCLKSFEGCLRQYSYRVCWQCWTLASWRCWWELRSFYPEPAAELIHRFVFGEWSVLDLTYRADETVVIDVQMLERIGYDSELDDALCRLKSLRPLVFWSVWPSSYSHYLKNFFSSAKSIVWEGGAIELNAPSLLSVLGQHDLGTLTRSLHEALVRQRRQGSKVRFLQGTYSLVGEVDPIRGILSELQNLFEPFRQRLFLNLVGGFFRVGTTPLDWVPEQPTYWFTTRDNFPVAGKAHFLYSWTCSGLLRHLKIYFPL